MGGVGWCRVGIVQGWCRVYGRCRVGLEWCRGSVGMVYGGVGMVLVFNVSVG